MTKRAEIVSKVFELIEDACELIKENDQCRECPMRNRCCEEVEYSLLDWAEIMSAGMWDDFIEYADHCVPSEELEELMRYAYEADKFRDEE